MQDIIVPQSSLELRARLPVQSAAHGRAEFSRNDGPQIQDYLSAVYRRKLMVALLTLVGTFIGFTIACFETPLYRVRTSLEIQDVNEDFLNMKQVRPVTDDPQGLNAMTDLQTQIRILQSEMVSGNTISALLASGVFSKDTWSPGSPIDRLRTLPPKQQFHPLRHILLNTARSLKVRALGQTKIIELTIDAPDPKLAARFANTLTDEYIKQSIHARWQITEAALVWIDKQLAEMRQKLQRSEDGLQQYARDHFLIFTSDRKSISDENLRQIQSDLLRARTDLVAKTAAHQQALSGQPDEIPDVVNSASLHDLEANLTDLKRQQAEMSITYKPGYAGERKLSAQIEILENAIVTERKRILSSIENEYRQARQRTAMLTAAYEQAVRGVTGESQLEVQYDLLKRETEMNRTAYEAMLTRYKELGLASALQTSNVRVIDLAKPPVEPFSPNRSLDSALGCVSGLLIAISLVVFHDRTDRSLRYPGEAFSRLGVSELGVIPNIVTKREPAGRSPEQRTLLQPEIADDFRTLLASILFSQTRDGKEVSTAGSQAHTIVITSASPGEGKTTVATNLAIAIAEARKSVLIIDGDLRKPRLHEVFGLSNQVGFGDLLRLRSSSEEASAALQQAFLPGLRVLTSGSGIAASADILFDSHLDTLLDQFKSEFDMIVIDTPPMMRLPDARLLARKADATILVTRANRTSTDAVLLAQQQLNMDTSHLLGIVLNNWVSRSMPYAPYV